MNTHSRALADARIGMAMGGGFLRRRSYFSCLLFLAALLVWGAASGSSAFAAAPAGGAAASAASLVGKEVELNGARMASGATLFPGDVLRLGAASTVALQFGSSLVLAAPLTELVVESRGVSLRNGRLQVRAGGGESFAISGPFFQVNLAASGGAPSSAEIQLGGLRAQVSAVTGAADLTAAGSAAPYRLHAGETATLDAAGREASAGQVAASPAAGQVSRLVPQVQIDRATQQLVAAASDRVYWNDGLRSGPTGRARVALKDGSQLNLGSDSSLRILQHDAQAQQTSLDLLVGRLRGKITPLTRPGAKFEIRTPVGVAGLVGTELSLQVTEEYVELMVFEGAVRFTALNGQAATVTAGMKLLISRAGAFEGPSPATPQEMQIAKDLTDVPETATRGPAGDAKRALLVPLVITLSGSAAAVAIGVWQGTRLPVSRVMP